MAEEKKEVVRPEDMPRITTMELANKFIDEKVSEIRALVGDAKVLLALSGGVDSSVLAALLIKAIGKQLVCVHVNHGLMRKNESEGVIKLFSLPISPSAAAPSNASEMACSSTSASECPKSPFS